MKFALSFAYNAHNPDRYIESVRLAEDIGADMLLVSDSPGLYAHPYVVLSVLAMHTERCRIGTFVSNPVTRHPASAASGLTAIDQLSGGRAFLGLSTGDSAVVNLGLTPATRRDLEEYVTAVRGLWNDGAASWRGTDLRFMWSRKGTPIYLAAAGPKGLRMAGRIADGVFIEAGVQPDVVDRSLELLAEGAAEAGRRVEDIDVWWMLRCGFGDSVDDAAWATRASLGAAAMHTFRFTLEGKGLPLELHDGIRALEAGYDYGAAGRETNPDGTEARNSQLVDELGLRDYLVERFGLVGTASDWVTRLHELEARGVHQVAIASTARDRDGFLRLLGRDVIPAVRAP